MIDPSPVIGDVLFAAHSDRALYLDKSAGNVQQEAAPMRPLVKSETNAGAIPAELGSHALSPDVRNDGNDGDGAVLATISAGNCSPAHEPAPAIVPLMTPQTASIAESEIEIGARRYASAQRVASMLGVSVRTLSRWDATRIGPPKIKVGKLILFELGKLAEWLASRETRPATAAGRKTKGTTND